MNEEISDSIFINRGVAESGFGRNQSYMGLWYYSIYN